MTKRQTDTVNKIRQFAKLLGVDESWACAIADQESSLGEKQLSETSAKGVFQMTSIAMKDLLNEMENKDDDLIDICCGLLYLRVLFGRFHSFEEATSHYCAPKDRGFYIDSVMEKRKQYGNT